MTHSKTLRQVLISFSKQFCGVAELLAYDADCRTDCWVREDGSQMPMSFERSVTPCVRLRPCTDRFLQRLHRSMGLL